MAMPLVNTSQIIKVLQQAKTGFELFDEFPSTMDNVRHGIYLDDVSTANRPAYQLGVTTGSNLYIAEDQIQIKLVTFQGDVNRDKAVAAISSLVEASILDGYHERTFTMDQEFLNRAEYRTFIFTFKRLEIQ